MNDSTRRARWTQERVVEAFRAYHARTGESPRFSNRAVDGLPGGTTVCRHFGSWNKALLAAGLPVRQGGNGRSGPRTSWTRESIVAAFREHHAATGKVPTCGTPGLPSKDVAKRLFGSWGATVTAAGFTPRRNGSKWPREEVIAALQRFKRETGRSPVYADFNCGGGNGLPSMRTLYRLYGRRMTVRAALDDAGLRPRRALARTWTRDSIVASLRAFAEKHGRQPVSSDAEHFHRGELPSTSAVRNHFGTWSDAITAAGFKPKAGRPRGARDIPRLFAVTERARQLDVTASDLHALARRLSVVVGCDLADAEDAAQDAWIAYAHTESDGVGDPLGWLFASARRKIRSERYQRLLKQRRAIEALHEDGGGSLSYEMDGYVEARLQLAELIEQHRSTDDVLHAVADPDRAALGLYEPIAQRRDDGDWLSKLPAGRWQEKLRQAIDDGRIPCVCWEHVREAGITPPPELAHHFPDCMGDRHGTLARREEPSLSPAMAQIMAALDHEEALAA